MNRMIETYSHDKDISHWKRLLQADVQVLCSIHSICKASDVDTCQHAHMNLKTLIVCWPRKHPVDQAASTQAPSRPRKHPVDQAAAMPLLQRSWQDAETPSCGCAYACACVCATMGWYAGGTANDSCTGHPQEHIRSSRLNAEHQAVHKNKFQDQQIKQQSSTGLHHTFFTRGCKIHVVADVRKQLDLQPSKVPGQQDNERLSMRALEEMRAPGQRILDACARNESHLPKA